MKRLKVPMFMNGLDKNDLILFHIFFPPKKWVPIGDFQSTSYDRLYGELLFKLFLMGEYIWKQNQ